MSAASEREPWELGDEEAQPDAPDYPTNEPIVEEQRGELTGRADGGESSRSGDAPDVDDDDTEDPDAGPLDDEEPPPERTHEEEGAVGAGSQYAAEDARDDEHAEPRGPAGAA
jgi:hypothetical protein